MRTWISSEEGAGRFLGSWEGLVRVALAISGVFTYNSEVFNSVQDGGLNLGRHAARSSMIGSVQ